MRPKTLWATRARRADGLALERWPPRKGRAARAKAVHPGRSAVHHLMGLARTHGISRRRVDEVIELAGLTVWPARVSIAPSKPANPQTPLESLLVR